MTSDRLHSDFTIEIEQVSHRYRDGHLALDDVDLAFGKGVFGLLGPNGAGKSTLMKILCTLIEPTAGQVRVCGLDVVTDTAAIRAMLGYLPQDFGAWGLQRVEEVLDTLAQLSGMASRGERRARVAQVLEQVGLADVADRKVRKLSGGMVRRLGVAQALVHEPDVLIVDEPTVGLDPEERIRFRRLMADLGRERTVLLSTHIVADLGAACREIAVLDQGEVVFKGAPTALVTDALGQVFEIDIAESELETYEQEYDVVSTTAAAGRILLRCVTGGRVPPDRATIVAEPTLEEGYMAYMSARGRTSAARQDEGAEDAETGSEER